MKTASKRLFSVKRNILIFLVIIILPLTYSARQAWLYKGTLRVLDATISFSEECIKGGAICGVLGATNRNLEKDLSGLASPLSHSIKNSAEYRRLREDLWPKVQQNLAIADEKHKERELFLTELEESKKSWDMYDSQQAARKKELEQEYERLGPPKLLYSCDGELKFIAGKGSLNYNSIYIDAKSECGAGGVFEIISSEK